MLRTITLTTLFLALAFNSSCDRKDTTAKTSPVTPVTPVSPATPVSPSASPAKTPAAASPAAAGLSDSYFLTAAPADAKDLKSVRATLKAGDKVVLRGRIGGSKEPIVPQRAVFTLVDSAVKTCDEESAEDGCKTPWDNCCTPRDEITANSAVVQVVGADGQPLKIELNGLRGLKPKATVTVVGTVAKTEGGTILINATGFFVKP